VEEIVDLFAKFHSRKVEGVGTRGTNFEATGIGKNGDIITVRQECVAVYCITRASYTDKL
jgi:hypothetical protein